MSLEAFALEFGFGLWCWWYYRGGRALLAVIVVFNLANLSFPHYGDRRS